MNETNEQINQGILSLDDIYFKDAFTKTEDKLNLEVNNADIDCMTSRNNKFSLDSDGNLIVNSLTANTVNIQNFFDAMYPIGSIYITINDVNPSTLFGGTWEQVKDTFLLCAGDKYKAGTIGGEEKHKLTIDEMPSHRHNQWQAPANSKNGSYANQVLGGNAFSGTMSGMLVTATGGNQSHNNMPPYQTVYVWKRIL